MILVRKKFVFSLYVLGKNKSKNGFSSLSPGAVFKTAHSVCNKYGTSWSRGIIKRMRPGTQKQARWRLKCACFWTLQWFSPFLLNFNAVAETVNHFVAHSSSFSSFTWKEMCYFNNRKQALTQSSTISLSAWEVKLKVRLLMNSLLKLSCSKKNWIIENILQS